MLGTVRDSEGVILSYVDEQAPCRRAHMSAYRRPAACLFIVYLQAEIPSFMSGVYLYFIQEQNCREYLGVLLNLVYDNE